MLYYENRLRKKGYKVIIGVDEVGRGPLAGPVVAAAVSLKSFAFKSRIDDSKKLSARQREEAFLEIITNSVFGIGMVSEKVIDRINILEATKIAMQEAIRKLTWKLKKNDLKSAHVIVDGNISLKIDLPLQCIIKGDTLSKSIASASILAKVIRDRIMSAYDRLYPEYGFARHKGYPTLAHRKIVEKTGPCPIHRRSFIKAGRYGG
ncbi:MAG: ribonuclease HII [Candidatus Omnitrophota bacterium]|nr:ribonuclease HII [Candidatus Omnitrophota bacterium]